MRLHIALLLAIAMAASSADAATTPRKTSTRVAFAKLNPCPATGNPSPYHCTDPRTGQRWRIEHMVPLGCGGPDHVDNLVWIKYEQHIRKMGWERKHCRRTAP